MPVLTSPNGQKASRFSFGTMQFGGRADEAASREMYDACRAKDINFFDTAYVYNEGHSETLLGKFVAGERDELIVATKVAGTADASPDTILKQFDESRKRLNMDMFDVLYLHRFDESVPIEKTYEAVAQMRDKGGFRYLGVSNYAAWQVMKAARVAAEFDLTISLIQPMYNLVKRQVEVEILPMCVSEDIAAATYSPLGGGLLTGKYVNDKAGRLAEDSMYTNRYSQNWMHDAAKGVKEIADREGIHPATLAVAWVARNKAVSSPIISAKNVEQLGPSLAAIDYELSDELYAELTTLSPTPAPATDRLEEAL